MAPDPANRPVPDEPQEPLETVDEFLDRVEGEFRQLDEDIQKVQGKGEWLKREPEM